MTHRARPGREDAGDGGAVRCRHEDKEARGITTRHGVTTKSTRKKWARNAPLPLALTATV
jgi:hypothetical protein